MRSRTTLLGPGLLRMIYQPAIKRHLSRVPLIRRVYNGWLRTHPIDRHLKVDTSGYMEVDQITASEQLRKLVIPYAGSSPSVVRKALTMLPPVDDYQFLDLGCGKGRAMIVASERPFLGITGVDLSRDLLDIAQRNIEVIATTFPARPAMRVHKANAVEFSMPPGKVVLFNYHAFGKELMTTLTQRLEACLATTTEHLLFVYYNPVYAEVLDASPAFTRWYAGTLKCDREEIGFAPDDDDTVVIWESVRNRIGTPHADAERPVVTLQPAWRAGLG
jgi:SAM-dependent methyltransferase